MTIDERHEETFEADVPPPSPPPPGPRSGSAMASFAQWEERGKGPSGPAIVGAVFSAGIIALGLLLVRNGVLAPRTLAELNEPVVKREWAPLHDVSAIGASAVSSAVPTMGAPTTTLAEQTARVTAPAAAPEATPATATAAPRAGSASAVAPKRPRSESATRSKVQSSSHAGAATRTGDADPYAHLEADVSSAPPVRTPAAAAQTPTAQTAPRILTGKNTTAQQPEPAPRPTMAPPAAPPTVAKDPGKSTWGGERTEPTPQEPPYEPPRAKGPGKSTWGGERTPSAE